MTRLLALFIVVVGVIVCQVAGVPWWVALFAAPGVELVESGLYAWGLGMAVSLVFEAGSVWGWLTGHPVKWLATLLVMVAMVGHGISEHARATQAVAALKTGLAQQATILDGAAQREGAAITSAAKVSQSHARTGNPANARISQRREDKRLTQARTLDGQRLAVTEQAAAVAATSPTWVDDLRPWALGVVSPLIYVLVITALIALGATERQAVRPSERPRTTLRRDTAPAANPGQPPQGEPGIRPAPGGRSPDSGERANGDNPRRRMVREYAQRQGLTSHAAVARAITVEPPRLSEWIKGKTSDKLSDQIEGRLRA